MEWVRLYGRACATSVHMLSVQDTEWPKWVYVCVCVCDGGGLATKQPAKVSSGSSSRLACLPTILHLRTRSQHTNLCGQMPSSVAAPGYAASLPATASFYQIMHARVLLVCITLRKRNINIYYMVHIVDAPPLNERYENASL